MKMPINTNPNEYKQEFSAKAQVNTIDYRGYYICESGINGGAYYLYDDGVIRSGVSQTCDYPIKAFWPTAKAAAAFLTSWRADVISEGAGR